MRFFEYLSRISGPLRLRNFHRHTTSLGLPEFRPPMPVSPVLSFLAAPIHHLGEWVGHVYLAEKEAGREFTSEDEDTLVISNARRYRDEQRVRNDLETLIHTSPVGVVVFDARTGDVVSLNREARRIGGDLHKEGPTVEQLLEVLTFQRASSSLDPAEILQFYRIINEQADHIRDLISDLLDVARIEAGTLSVAPEPSEVAGLVDQARNTFLSGGGRNNIHIDLPPDLLWVMADRRRIVQVLSNLLSNAVRYSPEWSTIRVTASQEHFHVAVSIADEGRSVPAERLPHRFRKFSRLDGEDGGRNFGG